MNEISASLIILFKKIDEKNYLIYRWDHYLFYSPCRHGKICSVHIEGVCMGEENNSLTNELVSLFDMKKTRLREEKTLTQKAFEAQRDIRYLTLMFCDGIPDINMEVSDSEVIKWDSHSQKLLYIKEDHVQLLEASSREVRIRMRPFLIELVKKAKDFYSDK